MSLLLAAALLQEWTPLSDAYGAKVLAPEDKVSMAGYWIRWAGGDPWPELMKLSDRHTHWGHKTEPPGSFGRVVAADGLPSAARRSESPDAFSKRVTLTAEGVESTFRMSRFSPALWFESKARSIAAFKGAAPRYLAIPTAAGIRVVGRGAVEGTELREPWVLVWRGSASPVSLSFVPSFLHCAPNPIDREDYERFVKPQPADAPWLVVFQRRPSRIALGERGLAVEFPGAAGMTALLPIGGHRWRRGAETEAWKDGLPGPVEERCRLWSRILKLYPEGLEEEFRVDGDRVHFRTSAFFSEYLDDWRTPALRGVPVSPVTGLALRAKLANLSTSAPWRDMDYPTLTGAWGFLGEGERATLTFEGWRKYAEIPAQPPERLGELRLVRKLEAHVRDMIAAGHLAPYESIQGTLQYSFWGNPADLASTLIAARRHVSVDLLEPINDYLREENRRYPILKYGWVPPGEGARREGHEIDLRVRDVVGRRRKEEGPRVESLYGLFEHSRHFDDWGWIEPEGHVVRDLVRRSDRLDWEIGLVRGGVADLNARIKGLVGAVQLAGRMKDAALADRSAALLVQALVNRFAFQKLSAWTFESGQHHVPEGFDLPRFHARNAHKFNVFLPAYKDGADFRSAPQVGWIGPIDGTVPENRYLAEIGNFWHDHSVWAWAELTPALAAFLRDATMPEQRNYLAGIEAGLPTWFVAKAENLHAIGEDAYFSPLVSWPVFQARALIFREPRAKVARFVDLPYGRGDLYYLQNLVAALDAE